MYTMPKEASKTANAAHAARLKELNDHLLEEYISGSFALGTNGKSDRDEKHDVFRINELLRPALHQPDYNPLSDPLLLRLHCLAASAFDQFGKYGEARIFIDKWASGIQFEVAPCIRELNAKLCAKPVTAPLSTNDFPPHAFEKGWFLQVAGILHYRGSKFDIAREYLKDSILLFKGLLNLQPPPGSSPLFMLTMLSTSHYWLGCVDTYANRFKEAMENIVNGLALEADASEMSVPRSGQQARFERFGKYNTGRLLMALGLLHYHMGALDQARHNLLTAKVFLRRDSQDIPRQLRADMLLLSVRRMEHSGDQHSEEIFHKIIHDLTLLAQQLEGKHERYSRRAKWTIGLTWLELADIYKYANNAPKQAAALQEIRRILDDVGAYPHTSTVSDQLQLDVLKIRTLTRLKDLDTAIDWGLHIIRQPQNRDHSLLYTEALFALSHAYYDRWKNTNIPSDLNEAMKHVVKAQEVGHENPRARAYCCLQLTRIFNAMGLHSEAAQQMAKWDDEYADTIQLGWIKRFATRIKAEMYAKDTLVFSRLPDTERVYDFFEEKLKQFLLKQVAHLPPDLAIKKLGISRMTYYKWRKIKPLSSDGANGETDESNNLN
jgi:tetratricopeptide (TPR) repeat protein